jgi:phospholipid/cholesterol/gamma-HCH transport system substrate-binding protein
VIRRSRVAAQVAVLAVTASFTTACNHGPGLQNFSVGKSVSGPTYAVTAVFNDATGLPIGGHVELHDVTIGKVQSMTTRDFKAYVHLRIQKSVQLPANVQASLNLTTPLGEEYVDLVQPAHPSTQALPDGGTISGGTHAPDVEDLLSAFSMVLNGGGIGQIQTITTQLNLALHGHTKSTRALIGQLNDVLGQLSAHTTEIDNTLQSIASLSGELASQHTLIERSLKQLQPGIADLHLDTAAFTKLLVHLSSLGTTATDVLSTVQDGLLTDLHGLAPTLDTLVGLRGKLGSTLSGLRRFAILLDRAVPGDFLNLDGNILATK